MTFKVPLSAGMIRGLRGDMNIQVLPDDDEQCRKEGVPEELIQQCTQEHVVTSMCYTIIFMRKTCYETFKKRLEANGGRIIQS